MNYYSQIKLKNPSILLLDMKWIFDLMSNISDLEYIV
jgi:hypothetical protein